MVEPWQKTLKDAQKEIARLQKENEELRITREQLRKLVAELEDRNVSSL